SATAQRPSTHRAESVLPIANRFSGHGRCAMSKSALLFLGFLAFVRPAVADDLDDAFAQLVQGRAYLKDYPDQKTRNQLVDDFLGLNGQTPNRPMLLDAIQRAIAIRQSEPPEPESFPS